MPLSTLDNESLSQLVRFKRLMRQLMNYSVDLNDLAHNLDYARDTFLRAQQANHAELLALTHQLGQSFAKIHQAPLLVNHASA